MSNLSLNYEYMFFGNHWVSWVGFYDFILNELFSEKIKEHKNFIDYMEALKAIHTFIPHKDIVFISDNPEELNINSDGRLHKDGSPAMTYSDGYSLFYLNGVKVSKELIETKPKDITKQMITKETNADVRREIIRKMGSDQLLKVLDYKVIDKFKGYELITFDIGDGRVRPFLKMKNPSLKKVVHVEGVRPEITTVKDAIKYRNSLSEYKAPLALT